MAELKGTKTEQNLLEAFAGESQARNKYTFYASVARKEGYEEIAAIFMETAENEREHAKLHLKALGALGNTMANLKAAAEGEGEESNDMYPRMAREARAEGFEEIAAMFEGIGKIEERHQERYRSILKALEEARVFKSEAPVLWKCRNCGNVEEGVEAPEICPVCKHPKAYFERVNDNY